ncbi:MAG: nucleoid-associated protein [Gemmiger sp.]|nr:nucleoid-associated protein [Gemmiger sp.]
MELKINQVIYHILDSGASEPLLSDRPMDMDADLFDYFDTCLQKAFAADEARNCTFQADSAFRQELDANGDFIDLSRRIAGVIFDQMLLYPAIPAADIAVADITAAGVPWLAVLKLNYRPGYTHRTNTLGNAQYSEMVPQRTLLPGGAKADEAVLIDRANGSVRIIEKKYEQDGKKDYYLSNKVFGCTQAMPEKEKLKTVCKKAVEAVQQAYPDVAELEEVPPFDGGTETAVSLLVGNQAVENTIAVEDVRTRIQEQYPKAAPMFEQALEEAGVEKNDRVTVSPARIKKLESRSFKTETGIEIKIPAELCSSDEAVEFIHSATGGLSLLIKGVVL